MRNAGFRSTRLTVVLAEPALVVTVRFDGPRVVSFRACKLICMEER
jgi:hypothetical protein